jgi:Zn finger protein HypA/HybF involved in hydrogenase expression
MERRFFCGECGNVYDVTIPENAGSLMEMRCPACNSQQITEAPPWAPLGSGFNIFTGDEWAYECRECKFQFRLSIPKSPDEDKLRKCPKCKSDHLHLITGSKSLPLYCG